MEQRTECARQVRSSARCSGLLSSCTCLLGIQHLMLPLEVCKPFCGWFGPVVWPGIALQRWLCWACLRGCSPERLRSLAAIGSCTCTRCPPELTLLQCLAVQKALGIAVCGLCPMLSQLCAWCSRGMGRAVSPEKYCASAGSKSLSTRAPMGPSSMLTNSILSPPFFVHSLLPSAAACLPLATAPAFGTRVCSSFHPQRTCAAFRPNSPVVRP